MARNRAAIPMLLVYGGFVLWYVATAVLLCRQYREFVPAGATAATAVIALLAVWLVLRAATGFYSYKTDSGGLTLRGPLRRRLIPWTDITSASWGPTVKLRSSGGSVSIKISDLESSGDVLLASIWQHLRQQGRAEGLSMSERALSLWQDIPPETPDEAAWNSGSRRAKTVGAVLVVAVPVGLFVCAFGDMTRNTVMMSMLVFLVVSIVVLLKCLLFPELLRTPCEIRVLRDGIQAQLAFRSVYMPWSQVTGAFWFNNTLIVRSVNPSAEVRIGYVLGSTESEQRILCLIRYLRAAGQAVPLPVIVSRNPEYLDQPVFSSRASGKRKQAFLNTLDPPLRKRMRKLQAFEIVMVFAGMGAGMVHVFLDVPGIVSRLLFSAPGTRFFVPSSSLPAAFPVFMGFICLFGIASGLLSARLAGPDRETWQRFRKIGSDSKFQRAMIYIVVTVAVLGFLSLPLFICSYTRGTDAGVVVNRPLQFRERLYRWREVADIVHRECTYVLRGSTRIDERYIVRFSDDTDWSVDPSDSLPRSQAELPQAIRFISQRSGKPIRLEL